MFNNVDTNVLVSKLFGVNNVVDAVESFKYKEYTESMTNLAKAALKWACMGAVCVCFSRLVTESPIYLNEVHGRAVNGLNEDGSQEISSDSKLLLDKYFQEQSHFKRWPQSGKDYVRQCLEGNADEASYSTRYFIEKSIEHNDSSALKEVIKSCSQAATTTKSCLAANEVFHKNLESAGVGRKLLLACRKSENAFCQKVREGAVSSAVEENDWDSLLKNCIKQKVNSEPCSKGLGLLQQRLALPSKETWSLAKKIDAKCRSSNLPVCLKSREFVYENIMQYGTWEQIIKLVGSNRRKGHPQTNLVEEASTAFIEEIIKVEGLKSGARDVYFDLMHRVSVDHVQSKVSMAMSLAEACVANPTFISKRNAEKLISRLQRYKNSLDVQSQGWSHYYDDLLLPILDTKIKALKEKIENLPTIEEPANFHSERASSDRTETPRRSIVYKFDCNRMDWVERNLVRMAGRQGALQLSHFFDRSGDYPVKEEDVDWESCGL